MLDCGGVCRFVTLTLRHSDSPLATQLDRLISSFRLLRKLPDVGDYMRGGVWFIEVKLDRCANRWHPHLHLIVEGEFISAKTLSRRWYEVTGDSYIVDIRAIDNLRERARYVAKYATKPLDSTVVHHPAKLDEFVVAIKGRRLHQCFGSWARKTATSKAPRSKTIRRLASVSSTHENAVAGDVEALIIMHRAYAQWPSLAVAFPPPTWCSPPPFDVECLPDRISTA